MRVKELKDIILNAKRIVVFSGAGLSTNSGIPDFRSAQGLYNQKSNLMFSPEEIISHSFFMKHTKDFYSFYFDKMIYKNARPNLAHLYFAGLQKNHDVTIITQNIDDLHTEAGSRNVIELHGNVKRNYCMKCNKFYSLDEISKDKYTCSCSGIIKPDVVLYEEGLNENDLFRAVDAISKCDVMIVVGTSLSVFPAAGLIKYYRGNQLVLINKTETSYDVRANLCIHDDIIRVIEELKK